MIRYALKCSSGHDFESWFQSADAFEKLKASGLVSCAVCGDTDVEKSLMAPRIGSAASEAPERPERARERPLSAPATPAEQALRDLKRRVEENADYVGRDFATEARLIHEGAAPDRAIWGEAKTDEARKLVEEGVPVTPLPFRPGRKAN